MKDEVHGLPYENQNIVLAEIDDDLTKNQDWHDEGYCVSPFLEEDQWVALLNGFRGLFRQCLRKAGLSIEDNFDIGNYHLLIENQLEKHLEVINQTKLFEHYQFPINLSIVENRISEILGINVKSIKPFNKERVFHFRVIRPKSPDYNPLHRDVWQDENKDAINIYVPIAGSNGKSSLLIVPGSHKWPESDTKRSVDGAKMNGLKFNVPGLISSEKKIEPVRPNPGENEVLMFSPYLLHGLSENLNEEVTRISLEMRFWRA